MKNQGLLTDLEKLSKSPWYKLSAMVRGMEVIHQSIQDRRYTLLLFQAFRTEIIRALENLHRKNGRMGNSWSLSLPRNKKKSQTNLNDLWEIIKRLQPSKSLAKRKLTESGQEIITQSNLSSPIPWNCGRLENSSPHSQWEYLISEKADQTLFSEILSICCDQRQKQGLPFVLSNTECSGWTG